MFYHLYVGAVSSFSITERERERGVKLLGVCLWREIKGAFPEDDGAAPVGGVGRLAPANRRARGARCRPQLIDESGGDDKPKKGSTCCCAGAKRLERRLTESKPTDSSSTRVPPIQKP